jgi:para-aminobenzoate synthetase component 1
VPARPAYAHLGGRLATGLLDVTDDLSALDGSGWWAVVLTYEGQAVCARFAEVRTAPPPGGRWPGIAGGRGAWASSLSRPEYEAAVGALRERIAAGDVYQANLCRVLSAALPPGADLAGLAAALARGNPAPFSGAVHLPGHGVDVVTASPELFLSRDGDAVESRPIKGTGRAAADLQEKDAAENVMIVDLVRNDLGRVCVPGSIDVPSLLAVEPHPGLVHLVSTVRGRLRPGLGWADLLGAAFPPGSVTGAPKSSALRLIEQLEAGPRGPYCGAVGWVDAQARRGELAVAIRTFWAAGGRLRFGAGAGITWGSDPAREWDETELKAELLVALASEPAEEPAAGTAAGTAAS